MQENYDWQVYIAMLKKGVEDMNNILKADELINLTCPKGGFEFDENGMLLLTQGNFEIIRDSYDTDQKLDSTYLEIKAYVNKTDYAIDDYEKIIKSIAGKNHTHTPKKVCEKIAKLAVENKLLEKVKDGKTSIVDEMIEGMTERKERKERSLLSKVCRYLETWIFEKEERDSEKFTFTINDSILRTVLPYYLYKYDDDEKKQYKKMKDDITYEEYLSSCNRLSYKCEIKNLHKLDYLLWYFYSKDSIRLEIIKHIYQEGNL